LVRACLHHCQMHQSHVSIASAQEHMKHTVGTTSQDLEPRCCNCRTQRTWLHQHLQEFNDSLEWQGLFVQKLSPSCLDNTNFQGMSQFLALPRAPHVWFALGQSRKWHFCAKEVHLCQVLSISGWQCNHEASEGNSQFFFGLVHAEIRSTKLSWLEWQIAEKEKKMRVYHIWAKNAIATSMLCHLWVSSILNCETQTTFSDSWSSVIKAATSNIHCWEHASIGSGTSTCQHVTPFRLPCCDLPLLAALARKWTNATSRNWPQQTVRVQLPLTWGPTDKWVHEIGS